MEATHHAAETYAEQVAEMEERCAQADSRVRDATLREEAAVSELATVAGDAAERSRKFAHVQAAFRNERAKLLEDIASVSAELATARGDAASQRVAAAAAAAAAEATGAVQCFFFQN